MDTEHVEPIEDVETELNKCVDTMETRQQFAHFLKLLCIDFEENQEEWEHQDIHSFLYALLDYATNAEQYTTESGVVIDPDHVSWRSFAEMLSCARSY